MAYRILIIEDETEIASYLRRGLAYEGFAVELADDGLVGLAMARARPPDLIVLDVMLPGLDGLQVAQRLRAESEVPIIMLTARESVGDRVTGLESGADDYMAKPFAFEELLARINVQLRHRQAQRSGEVLRCGALTLNIAAHTAHTGERRIELTAKEFELLELFLRHPNQVFTRDVIYDRIWGYDFGADSNVIEVYIHGLRQKLEAGGSARLLHTVRGVGYVLRA